MATASYRSRSNHEEQLAEGPIQPGELKVIDPSLDPAPRLIAEGKLIPSTGGTPDPTADLFANSTRRVFSSVNQPSGLRTGDLWFEKNPDGSLKSIQEKVS